MVPWNHFSIHRSLIEEVEKTGDIDQLKQISKNLIQENLILSHRTNTALKSIENQNTLINYLQDTVASMMARNAQLSMEFWAILASETLRTLDSFIHYQTLIFNLTKQSNIGAKEKSRVDELVGAAYTVPYQNAKVARAKFVHFLAKLKEEVPEEAVEEEAVEEENVEEENVAENVETEVETEHQKNTRAVKFQNGRINTLGRNKKQHYRLLAKRNACRTSRKHAFNKSQNNKLESSGRKNSRYPKLANSAETSQSDTEVVQTKKFSRRRKLKRKAEEINNELGSKSDIENITSLNKTPAAKRTAPTKRLRSTCSISNSINETVTLKSFDIILKDFMKDPSADNDQYIAQYKQTFGDKGGRKNCFYKGDEENSYKILDYADDDIDCDQRAESDHNSDNNNDNEEDRNSTKSHESENNRLEQESTVPKSTASDEENGELSRNTLLNGKKGPCTPPHSPAPDSIFRRGPRTPSLSPPGPRRGPRTPPGLAPTSDSEGVKDHDASTRRSGNPHSHR